MVKGIIENTHIISSKVTKFIWLLGYNNFSKIDMYFKTERIVITGSIIKTHVRDLIYFCIIYIYTSLITLRGTRLRLIHSIELIKRIKCIIYCTKIAEIYLSRD